MSRLITGTGKMQLTDIQLMAKQGGKLIFTAYHDQQAALLIQDNRLKAARFFPKQESKIGAVYICKVKNVVKNLEAYFVEIGGAEREICFLPKKEAAYPFLLNRPNDGRILEGDEFPVQIIRDAQKTKQAFVTTLISLSNDYFAFNVGETRTGYSNKFSGAEKRRLHEMIEDVSLPKTKLPFAASMAESEYLPTGMVVRTQAKHIADKEELLSHFQSLAEQWTAVFQMALHRTCFSCLLQQKPAWQTVLEQLVYSGEYEEILTDNEELFSLLKATSITEKQIRFYDSTQSSQLPLTKLYGLETKLDTALKRCVWLKSGGYLIIEPTEALTVIDVNSGKYDAKKEKEEALYLINREAAEEIAIQLRLRNLSGIIIADFINMKSEKRQEELLDYLRKLVRYDRQTTNVVDITPLGLVEITRKKGYKTLAEQIEW